MLSKCVNQKKKQAASIQKILGKAREKGYLVIAIYPVHLRPTMSDVSGEMANNFFSKNFYILFLLYIFHLILKIKDCIFYLLRRFS